MSRATRPISHCVGLSVCLSVGRSVLSHFAFFAFLSCLKVEKFRYEYFIDVYAPAQIITAPAQPPATGVAVYTALFYVSFDPELHFTIMYSNEICFYDEGCGTNPPCSIIKMLSILSLSCGMSVAMSSTFFTALIGHTATG